jgi:hypothetical protein
MRAHGVFQSILSAAFAGQEVTFAGLVQSAEALAIQPDQRGMRERGEHRIGDRAISAKLD